jgi:hypothetical protein
LAGMDSFKPKQPPRETDVMVCFSAGADTRASGGAVCYEPLSGHQRVAVGYFEGLCPGRFLLLFGQCKSARTG